MDWASPVEGPECAAEELEEEEEVEDRDGRRGHYSTGPSADTDKDDVDEGIGGLEDDTLTIPYEPSTENDDDDDFSQEITDSRFIDSGWGGDCLHDAEDIDFEFVYALHTFVATVEGQANATKGDTMVLLDDSNSYWWLVRVVKDSSIGTLSRPPSGPSGLTAV